MDDDVYARAEAWLRSRRDRQVRGSRAWLVLDGALREYVAIGACDSGNGSRGKPGPATPRTSRTTPHVPLIDSGRAADPRVGHPNLNPNPTELRRTRS